MLLMNSAASRHLLLPCLCTWILARPRQNIEQSVEKQTLYDQTEEIVSSLEDWIKCSYSFFVPSMAESSMSPKYNSIKFQSNIN